MLISLIAGLILGAFAIIFALQNFAIISVSFLAWHMQGSLALILMICIAVGVALCILFTLPATIRESFELSALKKQNKKLQDDYDSAHRALLDAEHKLGAGKTFPVTETKVILPDGSSVTKTTA